jgi:hypothetical protein
MPAKSLGTRAFIRTSFPETVKGDIAKGDIAKYFRKMGVLRNEPEIAHGFSGRAYLPTIFGVGASSAKLQLVGFHSVDPWTPQEPRSLTISSTLA